MSDNPGESLHLCNGYTGTTELDVAHKFIINNVWVK